MREQIQFRTPEDWKKHRGPGIVFYIIAATLIPVILVLMGWIAAQGPRIDYFCENFWR